MADDPIINADTDDLTAFETEFFKPTNHQKKEVLDQTDEPDEPEEAPDDADPVEDANEDATEGGEDTDEQDDGSEEEVDPEPKKKPKRSAQERIDELTREKYEERRAADLKIAELEARLNLLDKPVQKEEPVVGRMPDGAPDPNGLKDGLPVYPLGEFDPEYIRDLTRFTIKTEQDAADKFRKERDQQAQNDSVRQQAQLVWQGKLEEAQKEYPDIREKINSLEPVITGLDPNYGQYLVDVIMSLDNGPQVLRYCADNPKEAREIVSSGAAVATVKLGRLDALLSKAPVEAKKVTRAPTPPARVTRGTSGQFSVPADTDDLEAFEREFFR